MNDQIPYVKVTVIVEYDNYIETTVFPKCYDVDQKVDYRDSQTLLSSQTDRIFPPPTRAYFQMNTIGLYDENIDRIFTVERKVKK